MQLVAKAKPVKIRIKSGGEEHTSLNSLKRNFNISDIQPLLDGRLERWLYQQGENELAFKVSNFRQKDLDTVSGTMELIKIFFPDYIANNNINSLYDIIQKWNNSNEFKKNNDYLLYFLIYLDIEYTKFVYNHRDELQCNDIDWNEVFSYQIELNGNRDAEAYYIYGKLLLADDSKQEIAFEYMVLAAQLGWSDAHYFMDNFDDFQSNSNLYNVDKIRKRMILQWLNKYRKEGYYRFLPENL